MAKKYFSTMAANLEHLDSDDYVIVKSGDSVNPHLDYAKYVTNTNRSHYTWPQEITTQFGPWIVALEEENGFYITTRKPIDRLVLGAGADPTLLNDICATICSNKQAGLIGRSISLEDIINGVTFSDTFRVYTNDLAYIEYGRFVKLEKGDKMIGVRPIIFVPNGTQI